MSKAESAELILKLYELRREPVMREARNWMVGFVPESMQDIVQAMTNPETSAYLRMVTSYWEMAASFVNHGAIDEEMFNDANGEHIFVFSKIEPFLSQSRETFNNPTAFANLEKLVMRMPNAKEMLEKRREAMREMIKRMTESRAESEKIE